MYPNASKLESSRPHLYLWSDRGIPTANPFKEFEERLTRKERQMHPTVTGPKAPHMLDIHYQKRGYFNNPKVTSGLLA